MKKLLIILFILSSLPSLATAKENQAGFYGLLALGRGYNHFSADNFTTSPSYSNNNWVWAGRLAVGYNIDQYIGLEIGGRYFQQRKFNDIANSNYNGFADLQAYSVQTVIRWPFGNGYNVFVKFGPAYVTADLTSNASAAEAVTSGIKTDTIKQWEPMYSLGASMTLDDFPGVSALFEYSATKQDSEHQLPKAELYALGLIFQF